MLAVLIEHHVLILTVLLGISEALALIPAVKSNGVVDGLIILLKTFLDKKKPEEK